MTNMKKRSTAVLTAAILAAALTIPATATAIRISSYKGSTLEVGERSGLIIGPSGTEYTVTSSDPDTVVIEQVLTFWVAVAKSEGTAEITASNSVGGVWKHDTDDQLHYSHHSGNTIRWGQYQPDRQPGDTPGDDPDHQPDPQGQWSPRTACQ